MVDAHVVVLKAGARLAQWPGIALLAIGLTRLVSQPAVAVHLFGNAQTSAFPLAGLLQQMVPSDARQPLAFKANAGALLSHRGVDVGDQALVKRQTGQQGQISLGHTEGQVGLVGLAPLGQQLVVVIQNPRHGPSAVHRAIQAVVGRWVCFMDAPRRRGVTRPGCFTRLDEFNGGCQGWVHVQTRKF